MPKISKATASSQPIPRVLDAYSYELDGWTVSMETHLVDLDAAFLFKGAPNDQCQAPHMGYVLKGKYGMRTAEGVEEVYEAGDAFFVGPGTRRSPSRDARLCISRAPRRRTANSPSPWRT